jgi:hypothetical protein
MRNANTITSELRPLAVERLVKHGKLRGMSIARR